MKSLNHNRAFLIFYFMPFIVIIIFTSSCTKNELQLAPVDECDTLAVSYDTIIKPIIDIKCGTSGCHESGAGFGDFSNYAGLKAKIDDGKVVDRVFVQQDMPLTGSLDSCEKVLINAWINMGAPEN